MSKLYKNVVVLDSGAGFFALLVAARTPEVTGAAQFQLMELLQSLAQQGRTVVMVLHDLAHAMHRGCVRRRKTCRLCGTLPTV